MHLVAQSAVRSGTDGMPGCLELDEVANLIDALRLRAHPMNAIMRFASPDPFDALRRSKLQLLLLLGVHYCAEPADMGVRRECRNELLPESGQNVHHSTRQVRHRQQLAQHDRWVRKFLR